VIERGVFAHHLLMRLPFVLLVVAVVGCSGVGTASVENGDPVGIAGGGGEPLMGGSGGVASTGGSVGAGGGSTAGGAGAGGMKTTGGSGGNGGSVVIARDAGAGGTNVSADAATTASCMLTFPTAASTTKVSATIKVSGSYDGMMNRFVSNGLGDGSQSEGQSPIFQLADGSTLKNVIIGNPGADGIHCSGSCTLQNVWWEDVGEDAATLKGKSASQTMTIEGGGAMHAADKVFQHDGSGTIVIRNFFVSDFGKLYRSCGNCGTHTRGT
jgi:hypothetical protein